MAQKVTLLASPGLDVLISCYRIGADCGSKESEKALLYPCIEMLLSNNIQQLRGCQSNLKA